MHRYVHVITMSRDNDEEGAGSAALDVAIVEGAIWAEWSPNDVEGRGLGGSQTSIVRLARELVRRGCRVAVFGRLQPAWDQGVRYARRGDFDPAASWDAVIGSRDERVLARQMPGARRIFWAHDIHYGDRLVPGVAANIDVVVSPSSFHAGYLSNRYPFLAGKLAVVPNAIELDWFLERSEDRPPRVVYSSAPDRGLDVLLEIWPAVRARVPGAELWCCAAPVYEVRSELRPELRPFAARIAALSSLPGVRALGSLGQPQLARLLCNSRVWVAPSWSTPYRSPFLETFCIAAVEAQAAGCHVVASAVGALAETVKVGHLVTAPPPTPAWRLELYDAILAGLLDPAVQAKARAEGPEVAARYGVADTLGAFAGLISAGAPHRS